MYSPLISIGVSTFKRKEMLNECLASILAQTFQDFEILVGNDDPEITLNKSSIGFADERIRIYNYKKNIGERANLNYLLAQSLGRYFTWLADDDAYFEMFLETVNRAFEEKGYLLVAFTSYLTGDVLPERTELGTGKSQVLSGREFLRGYLSGTIQTQGCYGVFDRNYLIAIGGMKDLGLNYTIYGDVGLAILAGSLERLIYIDAKLIFYRTHDASLSISNPNFHAYGTAQRKLMIDSIEVFKLDRLIEDFDFNLKQLLGMFLGGYMGVMKRSGTFHLSGLYRHLGFLLGYSMMLRKGRIKQQIRMIVSTVKFLRTMSVDKLRRNFRL